MLGLPTAGPLGAAVDLIAQYWWIPVFIIFIVNPALQEMPKLPERLRDYRDGLYPGVLYTVVAYVALFVTLPLAVILAHYFPILNAGLLGYNFVLAPLRHAGGSGGGNGGGGTGAEAGAFAPVEGLLPELLVAVIIVGLIIFIVLNVWYEETEMLRRNYKRVGIWAAAHLIMGIPLLAVIPLFAVGVVFKFVFDRHGRRAAYAAHLTYNVVLITILGGFLILG